jgi:hypothetical protein
MHSVPVYISEMAPSRVRGMLVACKEALIVAGMLAGYTVSAIFIKQVCQLSPLTCHVPPRRLSISTHMRAVTIE